MDGQGTKKKRDGAAKGQIREARDSTPDTPAVAAAAASAARPAATPAAASAARPAAMPAVEDEEEGPRLCGYHIYVRELLSKAKRNFLNCTNII